MAIRTSDEFMTMIRTRIGDSTTDEDLAFIEDATDTINSLSGQETRVHELETENEQLRQKYRDRFFEPKNDDHNNSSETPPEKTTFESLFVEVK